MLQRAIQQPGLKQGPSQRLQGATHGYNAHRSTIGRLHRKLTTTAVTQAEVSSPEPAQEQRDAWNSFATNVSGEWEGVTASFTPSGEPLTLPEHYVPEAFREWGVQLWDWQSQCSSLATPDSSSRGLRSVLRRLMPTVGCEADAIAFTEEDASSSSSSSSNDSSSDSSSGLYYSADGSYSSGPAVLPPVSKGSGPSKLQVEHCFALPDSDTSSSSSSRLRVKVVQQFRKNWSNGAWVLDAVDLHREKFDGPYTGKRELAGCGGGQPGISQLPVLQANQLAGNWTADGADRLSCVGSSGTAPEDVQLTLLPLAAWSAVQLSPEGQLRRSEAGLLLGHQEATAAAAAQDGGSCDGGKHRLVSCRVYDASTGQLEAASVGQESKLSA